MSKIKKETRVKVWEKFNKHCAYCGCVLEYNKMQIDHITPKFRGTTQSELDYYGRIKGKDSLDNYNPSCAPCNSSKSTFDLDDWRFEIQQKKSRIIRDSSTFRLLKRFGLVSISTDSVKFYFEKEDHNG